MKNKLNIRMRIAEKIRKIFQDEIGEEFVQTDIRADVANRKLTFEYKGGDYKVQVNVEKK